MDETFHLTPLDARRYDFGRAMRGYDPARVERFREQVAEELERLTRQTQELGDISPVGADALVTMEVFDACPLQSP